MTFHAGRALSLWSALGMFLLLGIVKKNGILQVDYTNRLVAEGMPVREAIMEANRVRLRPILMTTLSIIAGLIPVAMCCARERTQHTGPCPAATYPAVLASMPLKPLPGLSAEPNGSSSNPPGTNVCE